jgi:hypothetical protein
VGFNYASALAMARAEKTIKLRSIAPLASQLSLIHTFPHRSSTRPPFHIYFPSKYQNNRKMLAALTSLSLVLASATLLQLCNAFHPGDNAVAYLTNCQTSDTGAVYSEVSLYLDVTQSFNGQNPDEYEDTSLGQITTWEGIEVTWSYAGGDPNAADTFAEFINANAQDPSVPTFGQVGCGTYVEGFPGGAIAIPFNCYKDNPRVLYTTSDHSCSTVYYCRVTHDACPLPALSESSHFQVHSLYMR